VVHPTQQKQSDADIVGQRNYEEKQKKAEGNRIKPVSLKTRYLFLVETVKRLCQKQKLKKATISMNGTMKSLNLLTYVINAIRLKE
jgi:methylmalonyl-CoA mutase N-terminal domain/subunit